ncbi:MAG: glycosyltransferase family 2 protein [Thermodesulfobacteriota bacterium]
MENILYSVVIPAYNEENYLPDTLKYLKDAMNKSGERGEIIVVDNNSTDRTSDVATSFGARVVFEPLNQISRARNSGASRSNGKFIIFLDADTHVSATLFKMALKMLRYEGCCGGGVLLSTGSDDNRIANCIFGLVNWVCNSLKIAPGCFIFCTRDAFDAVGGFNERFYAAEEVWFSNSVRIWGKNQGLNFQIINKPKINSSPRKLESPFRAFLALVSLTLLPFTAYFRTLCWYWYKRPK